MTHLSFPQRVTVTILKAWNRRAARYDGPHLAFGVRTFARKKNDYEFGPFFSGEGGVLAITRRQLELHVAANLSSGLMDYAPAGDAFAFVEIVHWSAEEVLRAIDARSRLWTNLLDGERELFGSIEALLAQLRSSGNHLVQPNCGRVRDEWDDASDREYEYVVSPC